MYPNNKKVNNMPAGLAAYHQKKQLEKLQQQQQHEYIDDSEENESEEEIVVKAAKPIKHKQVKTVKTVKSAKVKMDRSLLVAKLDEARLELFMNQERQKELRRLINKLNNELN